jgi:hypothetical protein
MIVISFPLFIIFFLFSFFLFFYAKLLRVAALCGALHSVAFLYVCDIKSVKVPIDKACEFIENNDNDELLNDMRGEIAGVIISSIDSLLGNNDPYVDRDSVSVKYIQIKEKYRKFIDNGETNTVLFSRENFENRRESLMTKEQAKEVKELLDGVMMSKFEPDRIPTDALEPWDTFYKGNYIPFNLRNDTNEYRLIRIKEKSHFFHHSSAFYPFLPRVVVLILKFVEIIFFILEYIGLALSALEYVLIWILKKILKVTLCCLGDGSNLKMSDESYIVREDMGNEKYTKDVEITKSFEPIENKYQKDYENKQSDWEIEWDKDYIKAMMEAEKKDGKDDAQNKAEDDKGDSKNQGLSFRRYCRRFGFFRKDAKLVSRRYKDFEKMFEFYSQRERIVGMSYKRTIFSQAFDNNGKVDKDYIRENFRTASPFYLMMRFTSQVTKRMQKPSIWKAMLTSTISLLMV